MSPQQQEKAKGIVDLVFLIDATGSMQSCIEALKNNIAMFIETLTTEDPQNPSPVKDWRARVFGYRDVTCDAQPFVEHPFVRDPAQLREHLNQLEAIGGGDEPESLLDAIYKIATIGQTDKGAQSEDQFKWRYRSSAARVVIIFTDASYHETMSIPEVRGGGFDDIVNAVQANRIILSIFAPDMPCYDRLSQIDKSEWEPIDIEGKNPQQALAEFTSDRENFRETLKQLAKSVSKSAETPEL
ncbi:MAG: VWA domain-containing protein [Planctomycetes bacterium]|nr:VWA domain-containing protein [Planctomycetota bacterium]